MPISAAVVSPVVTAGLQREVMAEVFRVAAPPSLVRFVITVQAVALVLLRRSSWGGQVCKSQGIDHSNILICPSLWSSSSVAFQGVLAASQGSCQRHVQPHELAAFELESPVTTSVFMTSALSLTRLCVTLISTPTPVPRVL